MIFIIFDDVPKCLNLLSIDTEVLLVEVHIISFPHEHHYTIGMYTGCVLSKFHCLYSFSICVVLISLKLNSSIKPQQLALGRLLRT